MNQEQKDTIREEFEEKFIKHRVLHGGDRYPRLESIETSNEIVDFILNKLDQAYQQGAKDKVEEITPHFVTLMEELKKVYPNDIEKLNSILESLKDNT
jgi:hypothetical protein